MLSRRPLVLLKPWMNDGMIRRGFRTSVILQTDTTSFDSTKSSIVEQTRKIKKEKKPLRGNPLISFASSPSQLDQSQKGLFFSLAKSNEELAAKIPEGWSEQLVEEFDACGSPALMVRENFFQVIDYLEKIGKKEEETEDNKRKKKKPVPSVVMLQGPRGIGKSTTLLSVVHWARHDPNWIVMYLQNSSKWVFGNSPIDIGTGTGALVVPSKIRPGWFSQPNGSKGILRTMKACHGEQLAKLPIRRTYPHTQYKENLLGIVERGIENSLLSGDALYDLRMELGLVEEYKVLVVVDEVNALSWPTCLYTQGTPIDPRELLVNQAFLPFDEAGQVIEEQKLKNGLVLCAPTARHGLPVSARTVKQHQRALDRSFFAPFNSQGTGLLGRPGKGLTLLEIEPYSKEETKQAVIQYKKQKCAMSVDANVLDHSQLELLRAITGSVPGQIRKAVITGSIK